MDRIEDQVRPVVGTRVPGNDLRAVANNQLMDITPDPDLLVAVGDRYGIVVVSVAHQGQRIGPRAQLVAGIKRRRWQGHECLEVMLDALADRLAMAAQDITLPFAPPGRH